METTKEYSTEIGGKALTAQFTNLTDQAHGSVILRYGNTVVLATAVMSESKRDGIDYFPLSVEYEEKFYAAGQILGSRFMRREGRPSDEAVLSGRAVDRTLRPLFDQRMRNDVQIVITILSIDKDDPDVLAVNAASLALATSDIPWNGPVSCVRVGKHEGNGGWEVNPEYEFRNDETALADVLACGKDGKINMIEVGSREMPEKDLKEALDIANKELKEIQKFQEKIVKEIGKEKRSVEVEEASEEVKKLFESEIAPTIDKDIFVETPGKTALKNLAKKWKSLVEEKLPDESVSLAMALLDEEIDKAVHKGALERDERVDGRKMDEVRPLFAQAGGLAPKLHGSGLFYRGGTHILSALTLGGPGDTLIIDGMEIQTKKRFMHHYNFPPFSVGETGRVGGFNRRMIGHGALAEKAVRAVIPTSEAFPYTIRIVSEALASNGSTSMGSICGSTLALMDAGVPIKAPVAGIAMGLITNEKGDYKILTDIQGPEDHHGDMDLKVAGTEAGITAMQMDVKVDGVPIDILVEAVAHAQTARMQILKVITNEIAQPREEISPEAPHIVVMKIKKDQIGLVIGGGGKTINAIKELTEAEIDIEEEDGDGIVYITGTNEGVEKARELIEELTHEYKAGEKFEGEVTRILDFGAFVKLNQGEDLGHDTEGLVHISELAPFRINRVDDVVSEGEKVPVVVKEIDEQGRINLSIKAADPDFATKKGVKPAEPQQRQGNNGHRKSTTGAGEGEKERSTPIAPKYKDTKERHREAIRTYYSDIAKVVKKQNVSMTDIALAERKERDENIQVPEKKDVVEPEEFQIKEPEVATTQRALGDPLGASRIVPERQTETLEIPTSPIKKATPKQPKKIAPTPPIPRPVSAITQPVSPRPRKASVVVEEPVEKKSKSGIVAVLIGLMLVLLGGGVFGYLYFFIPEQQTEQPEQIHTTLIPVKEEKLIDVSELDGDALLSLIETEKETFDGTLNTVISIIPVEPEGEINNIVPAREFLDKLAVNADTAFLRSVQDEYVLGVHLFDKNHGFLILKTEFFENAFAGMLRWEEQIEDDLPFLVRDVLLVHPSEDEISEDLYEFEDVVIANRDARALRHKNTDDIRMIYSFPDKNTLIITTNPNTLTRIFDLLTTAPQI